MKPLDLLKEQNIRLIQQLREKDDANFKMITERIKLENAQKILKEEKDACLAQVGPMNRWDRAKSGV